MSEQAIITQPQKTNTKQANNSQSAVIQRKCACGQHTVAGGECESCRKKRLNLQRWHKDKAESAPMSAIQPLSDSPSAVLTRPNLGHDFSQVQLRTRQPIIQRQPQGEAAIPTETTAEPAPAQTEATPTPEPSAPETTPAETAAPGLLVADDAADLGQGQMHKSEFLAELRPAVCAAADAELAAVGRDTEGCPYLNYWFDYYEQRDAAHIERALSRYAPQARTATSARDYIPLVAERVRQGVARWATTGEISGVPEGVPTTVPNQPSDESSPTVQAKARTGGDRPDDDPQAIQEQLGNGRSLDSGVRSRMESAFGTNFSHVRLHNDSNAAHISSSQNARALTVGKHVAFGAGEYQPGTMLGDALIAHELAHVVQQSGAAESVANMEAGKAGYEALEKDADETAVGAITSLWGKSAQTLQEIQQQAMPSLRSGLRLQRCNNDKSQQSKPSSTKPTAKTGSFAEKMTPFKTGVSGTIEFTPDPKNCPVCSKIRLVQIVQVFEKPGEDYKWPGSEAGRENVKTTEDKKKGIKPNFFVDHQAANCTAGGKCSIYYRDHWANPSASQDGSNNGTTAKKATLWDKPTGDADDIFNFETCARCDATGTYLRAFNWGFTADSSGNVTKNATSEQASPSATFIATVAKFDKYYGN